MSTDKLKLKALEQIDKILNVRMIITFNSGEELKCYIGDRHVPNKEFMDKLFSEGRRAEVYVNGEIFGDEEDYN